MLKNRRLISSADQGWDTDIICISLQIDFTFLATRVKLFSRNRVSHKLSNRLGTKICLHKKKKRTRKN